MIITKKIGSELIFTKYDGNMVKFDFKTNRCYKKVKDKWKEMNSLCKFFQGYTINDIIENCECKVYGEFLKYISNKEYNCYSVGTFVARIPKYLKFESYFLNGVDFRLYSGDIKNFPQLSHFQKDVIKFIKNNELYISLGFTSSYDENKDMFIKICRYMNDKYKNNKKTCRKVFSILIGSATGWDNSYTIDDRFTTLVNEFNYDYKKLIDYIYDYLPNREGFTNSDLAMNQLKDYVSMIKQMGGKIRDKYPKYLKVKHDIMVVNFNVFKKEYSEELFQKRKRPELEWKNKDYVIKIPQTTQDIKDEGIQNNNCVGSYVGRVINGDTYIVFLRNIKTPDESLVTVEIKDNSIVQAYRSANTNITYKDMLALKQFCKERNLTYKWRKIENEN